MRDSKEDPGAVALSDGPVHSPDSAKIGKEREHRSDIRQLLSHTLSRENLMALTGFFLCFFLVIHLFGNLQLLLPAEVARWQFNFYSKLLSENIFIELISYVLFASILVHPVYALLITNRYQCDRRSVSSKWYSRRMGLLGTIILFFLIIHLRDFWYQLQFGHVPRDKDGQKDLCTLVVSVYQNGWYVLPEANSIPIRHEVAEAAFDAAACIGCGACVATCKNSSAALFTSAKVTQLALLPQGQLEARRRVLQMVNQTDQEGFGHCSNTEACQVECPQQISVLHIARPNWEYNRALLSSSQA
jgi:succinate dehydrogenase / fumarate reductase cytochrome b subunit